LKRPRDAWIAMGVGLLCAAGCGRDEPRAPSVTETASPDRAIGAEAAPVLTGPVTIEGTVVDASKPEGLAGAVVIVLNPGVTSQEWGQARGREATQALMAGVGVTNARGRYEIPDLERRRSFTVMVTMEGYAPAIFEDGLEVTATDPPLIQMQPVELERE
jgi:hypothetical protein